MHAYDILSFLWAIALMATIALMIYRTHLLHQEEPELFLDDNADDLRRKQEHDRVVERVNFIQPFFRGTAGATAVLTAAIIGVEVARALPYVHF